MASSIDRPQHLDKLIQHKDIDLVKIVTGIRRSGKSTLLDLYHAYLVSSGITEARIVHMNMESLKYLDLKEYKAFYDYVAKKIVGDERYYLIFDELQEVDGWEKAIESFRLDFDVDIYITGSNAYLLSTEFSTMLSGRYVEIRMLPLSFKEFLTFYEFDSSATNDEKFQKYLQYGGMPVLRQYGFNDARIHEALEGIYSTVVLRDILQRSNSPDQATLSKVVMFLCSNIGSLTSPNNIGSILSSEGDLEKKKGGKVLAGKTVSRYIKMLQDAFVFYPVARYDIKGKLLLKTLGKHYIVDLGFRNMLLGYRNVDRGHILENVVFLELLRRDYRVYVGKVGEIEVDFIAEKPSEKLYIQVTESMNSPEVRERELCPLRAIGDNYQKLILSMDHSFVTDYDGILEKNLVEWLLD